MLGLIRFSLFGALLICVFGAFVSNTDSESLYLTAWADESPRYQFYPWMREARTQWADGHFPLWDPHNGLGAPLAANFQSAVFSPFRIPYYLSGATSQLDAMILARLAVAFLFAYLLLRRLGFGSGVAGWGALVYMTQPYFLKWPNMPFLDSHAFLPGVCWAFAGLAKTRTLRDVCWAVFLLAALLLGGHPEAIFFDVLFISAFVMSGSGAEPCTTHPTERLGFLFCVGAGAWGIASLVHLPFLEYLPQAWHYHSAGTGWLAFQGEEFPAFFIPGWAGRLSDQVLGRRELPPGIGVSALLLLGLSVAVAQRIGRSGRFGIVYSGIGIGLAMGWLPFKLLAVLPGFSWSYNFRYNLAGITLGIVLGVAPLLSRPSLIPSVKRLAAVTAILLGGLLIWMVRFPGPGYAYELAQREIGVAVVVALALALAVRFPNLRVVPVAVAWLAAILLLISTLSVTQPVEWTNFQTIARMRPPSFPENPDTPFPNKEVAPRIWVDPRLFIAGFGALWNWDDVRFANPLFPKRYAEYVQRANRESPEVFSRRFMETFHAMPEVNGTDWKGLAEMGVGWIWSAGRLADHQSLSMRFPNEATPTIRFQADNGAMAQIHLVPTGVQTTLTIPVEGRLVFRASTIRPARPEKSAGLWHMAKGPDGVVYAEFRSPWRNLADQSSDPFELEAHSGEEYEFMAFGLDGESGTHAGWSDVCLQPKVRDSEILAEARDRRGWWYRVEGAQPRLSIHAPGEAEFAQCRLLAYKPDFVRASCEGIGARLILRDQYFPGWEAFVDGKSVRIEAEEITFRGLDLPSGKHDIIFQYHPWAFRVGLWTALVVILFWISAWAGGRRFRPEPETP